MIKVRGRDANGRPSIVLGLSHGNLDRLRAGKPIAFDLAELGLVGSVLIFSGETEEIMAKELFGAAQQNGAAIYDTEPPKEGLEPQ